LEAERLRLPSAARINRSATARTPGRFSHDGSAARRTDNRASTIPRSENIFATRRLARLERHPRPAGAKLFPRWRSSISGFGASRSAALELFNQAWTDDACGR